MTRIETYTSMFAGDGTQRPAITSVEIPLIQRDYAQGRRATKVDEIREDFLDVLHRATAGDEPLSLDFIYGEQVGSRLLPLDGQQRLTTLFLLHWYLAARAGQLEPTAPWTNFSYATRPSAARFCQRLVRANPPEDARPISMWIKDQPWYLFVWHHDPTIQSMLVMLDAIQDRFADLDPHTAWQRLTDPAAPAISFHLLPLPDMGSAEDLYIKMNSRGKPLTEFENFKAHFERTIEGLEQAHEFAQKADGAWSDLLWRFRGDDQIIDDEFMRYLDFITEICEWSDESTNPRETRPTNLTRRAEQIFGATNEHREEHLAFLVSAFDVWHDRDTDATFTAWFRPPSTDDDTPPTALPIYFRSMGRNVNLFEACCRDYGTTTGGGTRVFTYGQTLLLYAAVLHLAHRTPEFPRRARTLRNLIEGSTVEMRADRMPRLVADTRALIVDGVLPEPGRGFSLAQIDDESAKRTFLSSHPDVAGAVFHLEDHDLLRGSIGAFELDTATFTPRAHAFTRLMASPELWQEATGALLTVGDYQRARGRDPQNSRSFQFATHSEQHRDIWRALLTGGRREELTPTRHVLGAFLDTIAHATAPLGETFHAMQAQWLTEREASASFDWRYYFVKYPPMREGGSGIYFAEGKRMGYSLCNLRGGMTQVNSNYRDPYLLTIWRELGRPAQILDPWYYGYEWSERWLELPGSGAGLRCTPTGFELRKPTRIETIAAFEEVCRELGIGDDLTRPVRQTDVKQEPTDVEDRILVGVDLARRMLLAGL